MYPSLGGHANYPTPGNHTDLVIGALIINDTTSIGPLWDPVKSAYFYTFTPTSQTNGTFKAAGSTPDAPVNWLSFAGRWGDQQYPDSDPRQFNFINIEHEWDVSYPFLVPNTSRDSGSLNTLSPAQLAPWIRT